MTVTGIVDELRHHIIIALGCPASCGALANVSSGWLRAVSDDIVHDTYDCFRSLRRMALPLPCGVATPESGITPAVFQEYWRRCTKELDVCCCNMPCHNGPVLCPQPGCYHEAETALSAMRHMETCPVAGAARASRNNQYGFSYADPAAIAHALLRRSRRSTVQVRLDFDWGTHPSLRTEFGDVVSSWVECVCEVDEDTSDLTLKQDDKTLRFHLDTEADVHIWSHLDVDKRRTFARCAFPRQVCNIRVSPDSMDPWASDHWVRDDDVAYIHGHAFCAPMDGAHWTASRFSSCDDVVSEEVWGRTLVIRTTSRPGGLRRSLRTQAVKDHERGLLDSVRLCIPGVLEGSFPCDGKAWRSELTLRLAAPRELSNARRRCIEKCLDLSCPPLITRETIEAEYELCDFNFMFFAFSF